MATRRTRPAPVGGLTDIVFTSPGLAASSSSVIQLERHRGVERDQFVQPALDFRLVEGRLAVEVEPPLAIADRAAGDGVGEHDREEVQRRVGAHPLITPDPVDPGDHACARSRQRRSFGRHVEDRLPVRVVDRIDDRDCLAAVDDQGALIAGLAAALRVEDRPIERDPAGLGDDDGRRRLAEIGIGAEEGFGHQTKTWGARP